MDRSDSGFSWSLLVYKLWTVQFKVGRKKSRNTVSPKIPQVNFETNQYPSVVCSCRDSKKITYDRLISLIMTSRKFVSDCQSCNWMKLYANELLCCQERDPQKRLLREMFFKKPSSGIILNRLISTTNFWRPPKLKCTHCQTRTVGLASNWRSD